jgi:hypothetical protein
MLIINLLKVGAIWLCDLLNKLWDPFEQATLPTVTVDLPTLEEKLFAHLQTNHVAGGKFAYQLPMADDAGDYALFQGLYLAMLALKKADTTAALSALQALFRNDTLIRGLRSDGTMNDTTSNDSGTGVLFGLWAAKDATLIKAWAQKICDSGYALTDLNGVPTQYGQLEQGWKTDPLRITLLLAILALAGRDFEPHYEKLYEKYRLLLRYPKVKLLWWDTDYDTHRAAIHLRVLWELTHDTIYRDGLRRIHRIMRKANNAWVEALCAPALERSDVNLSMLYTFTYEDRIKGAVQSINSGTVESVNWPPNFPSWLGFLGTTNKRAKQTLPIDKRGSQDFFWQRNMFSLDEWVGATTPSLYHSGLDFLICYWLAKRQGTL